MRARLRVKVDARHMRGWKKSIPGKDLISKEAVGQRFDFKRGEIKSLSGGVDSDSDFWFLLLILQILTIWLIFTIW